MNRCTGACCRRIRVWLDGEPATRADLRRRIEVEQTEQTARIWTLLRLDGVEDGQQVFRCAALTSTGCALERDDRPWMCTAFPYGGDRPCHECGARSDAEACGVALMTVGG